ncbi:hypothetical protein FZEAL_7002 [Fusarium zealandicum]|uniref:Uncharacterized protein n=1 Tax=Fusarium zealandicum TaxID=1053134 RepID=A0A8H4UHD7_9HYPO|nr:hypothetical protein FZEAL_7002 [Fusarium zealandicum]
MGILTKLSNRNNHPVPDEPPPSYDESESKHQKPPPQASSSSARPTSSSQHQPPAPGPSQPAQIPRQFPPTFNLYHQGWPAGAYTLGEHQNQPIYLYTVHSGLSSQPPVLLHSGPDESFPPLASAEFAFFGASFEVELPAVPGSQAPVAREAVQAVISRGGLGTAYRFNIEVGLGGNGQRELFEWRRSSGAAVASLGGYSYGWKLVRMARGPPGGAAGGNLDFVPGGPTDSQGNEVVATWARGGGRSLSKAMHFQFTGTGVTGLLGERWAIMTVITALTEFQREQRRR